MLISSSDVIVSEHPNGASFATASNLAPFRIDPEGWGSLGAFKIGDDVIR